MVIENKETRMLEKMVDAMCNMREEETIALAKELVDAEENPQDILNSCKDAMDVVGKRFEKGEYFLPELILAGEMLKQISEIIKPKLTVNVEKEHLGKVIIGTVEGDIHDIGKDIVVFMLEVNGFDVVDLGIDVPARKFVEAIENSQAAVVGLSGFLTLAFHSMKSTVEAISSAGFRDKVKIMIGGGQIDEDVRNYTGADAYGLGAMDAVRLCQEWKC
jgi:5-methyltetrahydrofolate--homocysteine methyltransferase